MNVGSVVLGGLALMVAFLLGWFRGRKDLNADIEPIIDQLDGLVRDVVPRRQRPCDECGHVNKSKHEALNDEEDEEK